MLPKLPHPVGCSSCRVSGQGAGNDDVTSTGVHEEVLRSRAIASEIIRYLALRALSTKQCMSINVGLKYLLCSYLLYDKELENTLPKVGRFVLNGKNDRPAKHFSQCPRPVNSNIISHEWRYIVTLSEVRGAIYMPTLRSSSDAWTRVTFVPTLLCSETSVVYCSGKKRGGYSLRRTVMFTDVDTVICGLPESYTATKSWNNKHCITWTIYGSFM